MTAKIAIGFDHAGIVLKTSIIKVLQDLKVPFIDLGTDSADSVDYPDYAAAVAGKVSAGEASAGILACGSGTGMAMTANKFKGVRAAVAFDKFTAQLSKEHNDANVLCLGARVLRPEAVSDIVKTWLNAKFAGDRHSRRVDKINQIEKKNLR